MLLWCAAAWNEKLEAQVLGRSVTCALWRPCVLSMMIEPLVGQKLKARLQLLSRTGKQLFIWDVLVKACLIQYGKGTIKSSHTVVVGRRVRRRTTASKKGRSIISAISTLGQFAFQVLFSGRTVRAGESNNNEGSLRKASVTLLIHVLLLQ